MTLHDFTIDTDGDNSPDMNAMMYYTYTV